MMSKVYTWSVQFQKSAPTRRAKTTGRRRQGGGIFAAGGPLYPNSTLRDVVAANLVDAVNLADAVGSRLGLGQPVNIHRGQELAA